jgi:hypothetical protein
MKPWVAGIFIFLLPLIVSAQSFLLKDLPVDKTTLGFRFLHPSFKDVEGLSFFSGVYDFSVRIPMGSKLNIVGSLPFATASGDDIESESGLGNIYVGLQGRLGSTAEKGFNLSIGAFLPTASEDKPSAAVIGITTNYLQLTKFLPNVLTITGNMAYHRIHSNGWMFGLELGPEIWIPTKGEEGEEEVYIHYGLSAGYRINAFDIKVEWAGIGIITEDVEDFGDRFINMLAFGVVWNRSAFRPGIFYKIYLKKDLRELVRGVIGIRLNVVLR